MGLIDENTGDSRWSTAKALLGWVTHMDGFALSRHAPLVFSLAFLGLSVCRALPRYVACWKE